MGESLDVGATPGINTIQTLEDEGHHESLDLMQRES